MSMDDWMLPPHAPSWEAEHRFRVPPMAPPERSGADAYRMGGMARMDTYSPAKPPSWSQKGDPRDVWKAIDAAAAERDVAPDPYLPPHLMTGQETNRVAAAHGALPDETIDALRWHNVPEAAIGALSGKTAARYIPNPYVRAAAMAPAVMGALADTAEAASRKAILSSTDVLNRLRPGDPNYWHRISSTKLDRPFDAIPYTESGAMPPITRQVNPKDLEGKFLMPLPGDPTKRGTTITSVDDVPLRDPFLTHGGRSYIDELGGFANAGPAATAAANRVKALENKYDTEVLGNFTKMGAQSADFSGHTWALLARMFPEAPMSKSGVEKMDAAIRSEVKGIKPTKAMEKAGETWHWPSQPPSVKDAVFEQYLAGSPHLYRQAVINAVEKQRGVIPGVPDVVAARYAATDPTQLHARTHTSGLTMTPLTGKTRPSAHPDYPVHLEGGASVGLGQNIPREVMYHDLVRAFDKSQPDPAFWLRKMQMPPSGVPYGQLATPKWVDRTSRYMEDAAQMGEIAALNKYMLKHHKWD